ncbi:MAG TPA: FHA domain-containing protein, partial [Polyangiaceae bacterium]
GGVWVRDLGSHNGTTLRAVPLTDEVAMGDGLELRLGREVLLVVRPAEDWPGAVALEVAGSRYVAPLGPARLGVGEWQLESAGVHHVPLASAVGVEIDPDRWVELVTGEQPLAFFADLQLAHRVSLLVGDVLAAERGGEPVLTLLGPGG